MAGSSKFALLRVTHVAEMLGIPRQSVLEMIYRGKLRSIQAGQGGLHFIRADEVERAKIKTKRRSRKRTSRKRTPKKRTPRKRTPRKR
jgi:excisionase family DNA binding protein